MASVIDEQLRGMSERCIGDKEGGGREEEEDGGGSGGKKRWRPANADESCLAHPVAMDTVRSSTQPVCVCVRERARGGGEEGGSEAEREKPAGML